MKHPRWNGGPALGGEFMDLAGANVLAERIRAAWAKCGHNVAVVVVPVGHFKREGHLIFAVHMPALRNGLPQ